MAENGDGGKEKEREGREEMLPSWQYSVVTCKEVEVL